MIKTIDIWVAACEYEEDHNVLLAFDKDDLYQEALDWAIDDLHNGAATEEEITVLEEMIQNKRWDDAISFWRAWIEDHLMSSDMYIYKQKLTLPTPMDSWWHIWGDF